MTVSDIFATSAVLSWEAPASDGGSPVTGYLIDRATNNSGKWIRVTRNEIKELTKELSDLSEGTVYEYRVVAVNKIGESEPSQPCDAFTAKNPYGRNFIFTAHLLVVLMCNHTGYFSFVIIKQYVYGFFIILVLLWLCISIILVLVCLSI